jgi:chitinase
VFTNISSRKIDNESGSSTGYLAMAQQFKTNFAQDTSKKYYLTAAPQCPYPDVSVPLKVCALADYVWVQFYNNDDCNVGQSGFNTAVKNWSKGIGSATLLIGALASGSDGDQGFVSSSALLSAYSGVSALNLPNVGGIMLWEAQLAVKNGNFQKAIKSGISSGSGTTPPPPASSTKPPGSTPTCSWVGHCAGATCASDDDCSDSLTCTSGVCGTAGSTPPPATCAWEGHCLGASCGSDDDCSDPYSCSNGVCSN